MPVKNTDLADINVRMIGHKKIISGIIHLMTTIRDIINNESKPIKLTIKIIPDRCKYRNEDSTNLLLTLNNEDIPHIKYNKKHTIERG